MSRDFSEATLNWAALDQIDQVPRVQTATEIKRWHKIAAGALPLALLIGACNASSDSEPKPEDLEPLADVTTEAPTTMATSTTSESTTTTAAIEEQRKEISDLLTVTDESEFDCVTDIDGTAELGQLDDGSVIVVPKLVSTLPVDSEVRSQHNRLYSDSIANPMGNVESDDTKQDTLREFQSTMCESPEVASMAAHYFANLEVDGIKVVDLNPWLVNYEGDDSIINDRALELVPQYVDPFNTTPEEAQEANAVHRELAGKLATLLTRFDNAGIKEDITTTFNYHLGTGNLQVGGLAEIEENDVQYAGNFLELKLTTKDGRCFSVMLINIDDQRIAEIDICEVPEIATTTTTTRPPAGSTTTTTIPRKNDDGELPGDDSVPADQDPGTEDDPGNGDAGQTPGNDGYTPGETTAPPQDTTTTTTQAPTTTTEGPPATTTPPSTTQPPVTIPVTSTTAAPPTTMPPTP